MLGVILSSGVIATIVSLIGVLISSNVAERTAANRLDREFRLHNQAERAAQKLLEHPNWDLRTFDAIERRLGGFEKNELRKILVQAGAVRFEGDGDKELWGLLNRNGHRLDNEGQQSKPRNPKRAPSYSQGTEGI